MTVLPPIRILSSSGAVWKALRWGPGNTTEGGQDKRAHIALRSVGCFCWIFPKVPHLAAFIGNVRYTPNPLYLKELSHIAGPRHVR
ncbi:hypothetical protein [Sphingobium quisquiliarum]|uniref:hypothetical protein n=1 Tax=Sphingobium quisquiliarum TaxID=538379 RepID=UPI001268E4E9|nr:hypothetical protein [Sphingobium quisquiliarum]